MNERAMKGRISLFFLSFIANKELSWNITLKNCFHIVKVYNHNNESNTHIQMLRLKNDG
jgi:hypothetical protein